MRHPRRGGFGRIWRIAVRTSARCRRLRPGSFRESAGRRPAANPPEKCVSDTNRALGFHNSRHGGRGGQSGLAVAFNVKTGQRVFEVGKEYDAVLAADISPDHGQVALGGPSKVVRG